MKIVYVIGGIYSISGMNKILVQKANYLASNTDFEIFIILTERPDLPYCYEISPKIKSVNFNLNFDELDTMPIHKKFIFYKLKQIKYKKLFSKYLNQIKPDITISALRREINFINDIKDGSKKIGELHFSKYNYRNINIKYLPPVINNLLTKIWLNNLINNINKLDKFVVLTEEDRKTWGNIKNITVIPNFLSYFPSEKATLTSKKAIALGRYTWIKGFELMIKAWSKVMEKYPDWELNIYGSGDKKHYEELSEKESIDNTIIFHEATKNIYDKFNESSICIVSSRYEGFGMVIIESMSAGVPVISFDCPCGPKDIINNNIDGILVENGNVDKLANEIIHLIEEENFRKELGNNAFINCKKYKKEIIMQKWINLFNDLMK